MTREEIENKLKQQKECLRSNTAHGEGLKIVIADLEKQLAELEDVEVYEPLRLVELPTLEIYTEKDLDYNIKVQRHNAEEELKKLISEENAKQGWKVDWKDGSQEKYFIGYYNHNDGEVSINWWTTVQEFENELYFSEKSSQDQDFLDKIKPLWLNSRGIE